MKSENWSSRDQTLMFELAHFAQQEQGLMPFRSEITSVVRKDMLLEKLKNNLEKHRQHFQQALEGWRKETIESINAAHKEISSTGKLRNISIISQPPSDMSQYYEQAIMMLEWDQNDKLELDQMQFQCFVQDQWDWSNNWTNTNSKYLMNK